MKVISIGINHAGTSMIRTLASVNKNVEIVAYDQNNNISFLGCGIALWVGGEFEKPDGLFYSSKTQLENMGAKILMEHRVEKIDAENKTVTIKNLATDKIFTDTYDKLVFAGGTWPIVPPFPGVDLENIFLSKIFQHAQAIKAKNEDDSVKNVVVIGAGYIGVELVEAFSKAGKNVTLVDMMDRVIPRYFDRVFTDVMEKRMEEAGVKLALGQKVQGFEGKDGKVTKVMTDKGEYQADMVIMSIGFRPQTHMLKDIVDMLPDGSIKVDERMRSSNKDIYAIGDSTALKHAVLSRANVALATNAVKTGLVAGLDLAGKGVDFPGVVGTNAINVFGCHFSSTGISEGTAKHLGLPISISETLDKDRPEFMHNAEDVRIKITYDPETLVLKGAQIGSWGNHPHTEAIFSLSLAIQKKMKLTDIALMDFYFLPHYNKPFNYILTTVLKALGLEYPETEIKQ